MNRRYSTERDGFRMPTSWPSLMRGANSPRRHLSRRSNDNSISEPIGGGRSVSRLKPCGAPNRTSG